MNTNKKEYFMNKFKKNVSTSRFASCSISSSDELTVTGGANIIESGNAASVKRIFKRYWY